MYHNDTYDDIEGEFGFDYTKRRSRREPAEKINDLDYADDIALLENLVSIANEQLVL